VSGRPNAGRRTSFAQHTGGNSLGLVIKLTYTIENEMEGGRVMVAELVRVSSVDQYVGEGGVRMMSVLVDTVSALYNLHPIIGVSRSIVSQRVVYDPASVGLLQAGYYAVLYLQDKNLYAISIEHALAWKFKEEDVHLGRVFKQAELASCVLDRQGRMIAYTYWGARQFCLQQDRVQIDFVLSGSRLKKGVNVVAEVVKMHPWDMAVSFSILPADVSELLVSALMKHPPPSVVLPSLDLNPKPVRYSPNDITLAVAALEPTLTASWANSSHMVGTKNTMGGWIGSWKDKWSPVNDPQGVASGWFPQGDEVV
jgi:hypothetical protein